VVLEKKTYATHWFYICLTGAGSRIGYKRMTLLSIFTKPFQSHHELHKLMSMGFLPFLAPLVGAIGSGLGAAAGGLGSALGGLGGAAGGLMKAGGGLLGKGLGGIGKTLFGGGLKSGSSGLFGSLLKGGKQLYGGLDTMSGGLLPGGQSPFQQGGLFGAFSKSPTVADTRPFVSPSKPNIGNMGVDFYGKEMVGSPVPRQNNISGLLGGPLGKASMNTALDVLKQRYRPQPAPPPSSYDPRRVGYSSAPPAAGPESGRGALFNNFSA